MKERVYKYIKEHPHMGANEISKELNESALDTLEAINELVRDGYVKMDPAVPLCVDNDCSCYYTATRKVFSKQ